MNPLYIWLIVAVIFILLEIAAPAFLFICFTAGAIVAGLASLFTGSYVIQVVLFAVISITAIPISRPLANRLFRAKAR